jgi:hypothetical protein
VSEPRNCFEQVNCLAQWRLRKPTCCRSHKLQALVRRLGCPPWGLKANIDSGLLLHYNDDQSGLAYQTSSRGERPRPQGGERQAVRLQAATLLTGGPYVTTTVYWLDPPFLKAAMLSDGSLGPGRHPYMF